MLRVCVYVFRGMSAYDSLVLAMIVLTGSMGLMCKDGMKGLDEVDEIAA